MTEERAGWLDLFRDGRAAYSILLNVGVILHAINILVISTIMPSVASELGGISLYAWPAMAYMVGTIAGAASGEPALSALHRRGAYVLAAVIFGIGALASAVAPSMSALIAGQLVQGFGGGLLTSLSMALVGTLYEGALRTRILSLITTTWSIAAVIGPAVGGVFADMGWWRGVFWLSVVSVALFAVASWRRIPASGRPMAAPTWPFLRIGLISLAVLAVGVTGQLRSTAATMVLVIVAIVLAWTTFRIDATAERRLFPSRVMSLFSPVGTAYWVSFLLSFSHMSALIFMPLVLQILYGVSPLWVGYFSMLFSIAWTAGSLGVAGWRDAWSRAAMFWGLVITAVSIAGLAAGIGVAPIWVLAVWVTVLGIGIGVANVHAISWTMSAAIEGEESVTASAMPAVRSLGIAFAAAISGLIANSAGLGDGATQAAVANAMGWLYSLAVLPPAIAALLVIRMLRLAARVS